jgi:hypothetical protein
MARLNALTFRLRRVAFHARLFDAAGRPLVLEPNGPARALADLLDEAADALDREG